MKQSKIQIPKHKCLVVFLDVPQYITTWSLVTPLEEQRFPLSPHICLRYVDVWLLHGSQVS